ncbi:EamA family transporter [Ruania zhangjianzhongii]|uniref:EamA family transporter n=1 Tax=Ruania zhangjianzhongii TaxID=2603206 RepID=UPI0011CBC9AC|nr:EamA family transporter [Ruania zhangjianzhongii]
MGVLLALGSALSYGLSDVAGGLASRRISFVHAAFLGQAGGLVATAVVVLIAAPTPATSGDLAWGAASGVGTGAAMTFLFRGISRGAMSLVVPLSAVGGVALPVLVGAAFLGERPTGLTWIGVLIALPALWLMCRSTDGPSHASRAAIIDGLVAGGGIALQYLCLAQAGPASGLWPILSGRGAALAVIVVAALTLFRGATGRAARRELRAAPPSVLVLSLVAGVLAAVALTAYLFALRGELLTVTVVLSSLYPVVPVVVGLLFLGERLRAAQVFGLAAALLATTLIVLG